VFDRTRPIGSPTPGIPQWWVAASPDRPYARRVSPEYEGTSELCPEPLLLSSLIDVHSGNTAGNGAILEIMRGLMESPRTDAERAGEQLAVFGWQVDGPDHTLRWVYRVVGRDTGEEHARFILAVPWAPSDLPCRLLGLQLQITLNGVENASSGELDAYIELSQAARG
jgi:hypothetical protein